MSEKFKVKIIKAIRIISQKVNSTLIMPRKFLIGFPGVQKKILEIELELVWLEGE